MDTSTAPGSPTAINPSRTPTVSDRRGTPRVAAPTGRQRRLGVVALVIGLSTAAVALLLAVQQLTW